LNNDMLKKILIIDDNEVHLVIAGNILKDKYDVITAKSGKEALALLSRGLVPNAILLDVLMPELDGQETFNKIKGISLLRNVPISFLTYFEGMKEKLYTSETGLKTIPYESEELLDRIYKMMEAD